MFVVGKVAVIDDVKSIKVALEMRQIDANKHRVRQREARRLDNGLQVLECLLGLSRDARWKRRRGRVRIGRKLARYVEPAISFRRVMIFDADRRRRSGGRRGGA